MPFSTPAGLSPGARIAHAPRSDRSQSEASFASDVSVDGFLDGFSPLPAAPQRQRLQPPPPVAVPLPGMGGGGRWQEVELTGGASPAR